MHNQVGVQILGAKILQLQTSYWADQDQSASQPYIFPKISIPLHGLERYMQNLEILHPFWGPVISASWGVYEIQHER
jgi:hypothetical protein